MDTISNPLHSSCSTQSVLSTTASTAAAQISHLFLLSSSTLCDSLCSISFSLCSLKIKSSVQFYQGLCSARGSSICIDSQALIRSPPKFWQTLSILMQSWFIFACSIRNDLMARDVINGMYQRKACRTCTGCLKSRRADLTARKWRDRHYVMRDYSEWKSEFIKSFMSIECVKSS